MTDCLAAVRSLQDEADKKWARLKQTLEIVVFRVASLSSNPTKRYLEKSDRHLVLGGSTWLLALESQASTRVLACRMLRRRTRSASAARRDCSHSTQANSCLDIGEPSL